MLVCGESGPRHVPLTGGLEEQPLDEGVLVLLVRDAELMLLVELVDEIQDDRAGLPVVFKSTGESEEYG